MNSVLFILPVAFLIASVMIAVYAVKKGKKARSALAVQMLSFLAVCVVTFAVPVVAHATTTGSTTAAATTTTSQTASNNSGMGMIAMALATGLACIGGGIAVAAGAPAAIGATSEDPKAFGKALIFVALGEGIPIYGLLISIMILGKV
ncbi:MAG: hypothetical protein GX424_08315 [Clostridiales bacterium]|nr:hypothetical protein [Clostridiales bacterium]